ncbi:MAG: hypothetical protein ACI9XC_000450 [Gammaproteobacteria bacterium]|jgi:hypothetical protein
MTSDKLNLYKKHLYKISITLIVGVSIVFILNELNAYYEILEIPITFEPTYLIYGLITQALFLIFISFAWKYNILICANKIIPLKSCFSQVSLVMVGKYIPGKIWGMYARSLNLLSHNITYKESLLGTYIEQVISVHSGLAFGILSWLFAINSALLIPVFSLILLSIYFAPLMQNNLFRLISKFRKKDVEDEIETIHFELGRSSYLKLFSLYLVEWIFVGLIFVSIYFALFNESRSADFIFLLMGSSAIAFVAGFFAIFAPGGIGVREGVIVSLISQYMPLTDSIVLAVAFRLWFTCFDIFAGLLGLMLSDKPVA